RRGRAGLPSSPGPPPRPVRHAETGRPPRVRYDRGPERPPRRELEAGPQPRGTDHRHGVRPGPRRGRRVSDPDHEEEKDAQSREEVPEEKKEVRAVPLLVLLLGCSSTPAAPARRTE